MTGNEAERRGLALRAVRKLRGLTLEQVGGMIQANPKTVSDIEHGRFENPTTLPALLAAYDISEADLAGPPELRTGDMRHELSMLRRYPREVFIALLVWGAFLSRMSEKDLDERIAYVSRYLADQGSQD